MTSAAGEASTMLDSNEDEYDFDNNINPHDGEMDYAASDYPFKSRLLHFLRGERISVKNRPVVEIALLIEVGTYIVDQGQLHNNEKNPMVKERYLQLINDFEESDFETPLVCASMKKRFYRAQSDIKYQW